MTSRREDFLDCRIERIVDCRVDTEDKDEVAASLAAHREAAATIEAHRALNARLRERFDPVLEESIPGRLIRSATRGRGAPPRDVRRPLARAAVVAALALAGALAGWAWWEKHGVPAHWLEFAENAAYAHRLYAADPDHPVELGTERSRELLAWLSRHLAMAVDAPVLVEAGYRFIGGRLLPAADAAAGLLMYEHPDGGRISIYLRGDLPSHREVEFQFAEEDGVSVLYWLVGPRGYALAGPLDRTRLLAIGKLVYDQLGS